MVSLVVNLPHTKLTNPVSTVVPAGVGGRQVDGHRAKGAERAEELRGLSQMAPECLLRGWWVGDVGSDSELGVGFTFNSISTNSRPKMLSEICQCALPG